MDILNKIPDSGITLGPTIKITDPIMFNVCLAACAEPTGMKKTNRYWLQYLHLDIEHKRVTGANGFMMCCSDGIDFSGWDDGKSMLIRPERPLPSGAKSVEIHKNQQFITGIDGYGRSFEISYLSSIGQYPDISTIVDSINEDNSLLLDRYSFNPRYLMKLLDAINSATCWPVIRPYHINNGNPAAVGYDIKFIYPGIMSNYTTIITSINN